MQVTLEPVIHSVYHLLALFLKFPDEVSLFKEVDYFYVPLQHYLNVKGLQRQPHAVRVNQT